MEKEEFIPKTKKKGLKITLAILLIVGVLVGTYFLYQYKFNNPNAIVKQVLNNIKSNAKNTSKINEKYKYDGLLKIDTNMADENTNNIIKNLELQINGQLDYKEQIGNVIINTKYKNEKFVGISTYYEKNNLYLLLNDLYDKYIKFENKNEINTDSIDSKDAQIITNSIIDALKKEIDNLKIEQSNSTITIDGKDVKAIENKITLNNEQLTTISKNILTSLKNNKEFIKTMDKVSKENTTESINKLLENVNKENADETCFISFYTDNGLFNKKLISVRLAVIDNKTDDKLVIEIDKINDNEVNILISTLEGEVSFRIKKNGNAVNSIINMKQDEKFIKILFNVNYEKINTITKPDVSNNKDMASITEQELNDIQTKLMENKTLLKLIEEISKTSNKEA